MPHGWVEATLAEVADITMGQSPPGTTYNRNGDGLPFFQGKAEFGEMHPTPSKWCSSPKKIAETDDILVSVRAPVGPTNLTRERCCIGRGLAAVRPRSRVSSHYLLWYLRSVEHEVAQLGTGSTFTAISGDVVRALRIPVAPLAEQRRIVAAIEERLSDLDAAVTGLRDSQRKCTRYREAVLRAAAFGELTRCHDASRSSWERASIGELIAEGRKCAYGVLQPGADVDGGVPLVRVGDISHGRVSSEGLKRISPAIAARFPRTKLCGGELLMTLVGSIGRTAVAPRALAGANTARAVAVIPLGPRVRAEWLNIWFSSPVVRAQVVAKAHEVARKTLNLEDVRGAIAVVPPLAEQDAIVEEVSRRLTVTDRTIAGIDVQLTRAAHLRQSILKRAFEGKLVPQDPTDEPAGVLLERIRTGRVATDGASHRFRKSRARRK